MVPDGASVGSMILTFANDVASHALTSGTTATTTIKFQGQHAGYTFSGTESKHDTFQVTQFNFSEGTGPGAFWLYFYKPGRTSYYAEHYFSDNGSYVLSTPISGTWTVQLVPGGASVGSLVLTMS